MSTVTQAQPVGNGTGLDAHVLAAPERGAGYFYPATAPGTSMTLFGFAITLGLLSLLNIEVVNPAALSAIVPVALTLGGAALLIGGVWDFRAGNMFGGVVGISYGMFWVSFALMVQYFAAPLVETVGAGGFGDVLGAYLFIWVAVTAGLTLAAAHVNKIAFVTLALLTVVFAVLAFANTGASEGLTNLGGWLGLVDAALAFYLAMAIVVNVTSDRALVPVV